MDKATYLKLRALRAAETTVKYQREDYCYQCVRLVRNCLCSLIKPFHTQIHFVLLMHPKEARKEKIGTGRISNLFLTNSQIIIGVDFSDDRLVNSVISDTDNHCFVLYPGKQSLNISEGDVLPLKQKWQEGKRFVVFLIDGTWPCAKKIMRLSENLQNLPRLSFSPNYRSIFEIKQQPADFCLSTIESIHCFIKEWNLKGFENTEQQEDQMITVFKTMIDYQINCSVDPMLSNHHKRSEGFTKRAERLPSKKWSSRNIVLAD